MEIVYSSLNDQTGRFILRDSSPGFANSLRRAMVSEVPTLAIEDVRIYDNTSALFDEMLAHRLGLIPIKTDLTLYQEREKCSCGGVGCPLCTVTYTMSVEGPTMVYSRDLIPQDPSAVPALEDIPIVKLIEGQKLVVEARAVLSTGKEHAKWQATTVCGYKNYPVISIKPSCDGCGICVEECPKRILEVKDGHAHVLDGRIEVCSLCKLCEKACLTSGIGDEPAIGISTDRSCFIFVLEGDGSLPVKEITIQGLNFLKNRSDDLARAIADISGGL
ncbi:MAG: DNA-directed RNA polymerase subunit D [Methanomicrobiales archaeon]|jgi:DNA-directed RNA polymerase subunit D|nr:DNA-directed RNA polymerase subunit D [Methanomicrobiales archaeon]